MKRRWWMGTVAALDGRLGRLSRARVFALAAVGVVVVGAVDYASGFEVSLSLFYLGPVAVAAWYSGRRSGLAIAAMSCISWYLADIAAGNEYSHAAIPIWNALVRYGFFLLASLLLTTLKTNLTNQRSLAQTDSLTGLYSRRAFQDRLEHGLALSQRRGSPLTLAYLDLDDFKALNDNRGHAEGDRALQIVGRVLTSSLRKADTAARLGGDEFALSLPDTDFKGARSVITKVVKMLDGALASAGFEMTWSAGVVTFEEPDLSPAQAVAAADTVMYEVKRQGKGAVEFRAWGEPDRPRAATGSD